jgi:hypothetical protein
MLSGWTTCAALGARSHGTEFVTIGVPDDFHAVRVGLPNVNAAPWMVEKIIACSSSRWNDYFNPVDSAGSHRPSGAWSGLTFLNRGADNSSIVTKEGATTMITVAGNSRDPASGEASNPAWTFTDWVSCASAGADPATGMRVLMLRALVPGGQTVSFTNGAMDEYTGTSHVNKGYDYFVGGLKEGHDMVTDPGFVSLPAEALRANRLVNGQMMCLVQVMTRNAGIVGMVTGDSHQSGTNTRAQINNLLLQCILPIGQETVGTIPVGMVSTAAGGAISQQFFPRMTALLQAVRPAFVVMPGWTANELGGETHANQTAEDIVFARMLLAADEVRDAGALPIFLTPFPRDAAFMTSAVLSTWLARREAMLAMRAPGEFVLDATSLLGEKANGQFTGTYLEGLSSDTVHPNDAGHAIIAGALTPVVRSITGLSLSVAAPPSVTGTTDGARASATRQGARRAGGRISQVLMPWKRRRES